MVTGNGFNPEDLQALDADRLIGLLHAQGIDVSGLPPDRLQQVIEAISSRGAADTGYRS